jgi:hypothetical protein
MHFSITKLNNLIYKGVTSDPSARKSGAHMRWTKQILFGIQICSQRIGTSTVAQQSNGLVAFIKQDLGIDDFKINKDSSGIVDLPVQKMQSA